MSEKEEQRKQKRVSPSFTVRTQVFSRQQGVYYTYFSEVLNVSEGGLCLRSPQEFTKGNLLQIFLPRRGELLPYRVSGKVVWVKPAGRYAFQCGIELLADHDREPRHVKSNLQDIIAYYSAPFSMPSHN